MGEQADAPLLAALRPLQLALVAVGGGVRAAHGRHHRGTGPLFAHAGGSAGILHTGFTHGAKATQHPPAGWRGTRKGQSLPHQPLTRRPSAHLGCAIHSLNPTDTFTRVCMPTHAHPNTGTRVCPSCPHTHAYGHSHRARPSPIKPGPMQGSHQSRPFLCLPSWGTLFACTPVPSAEGTPPACLGGQPAPLPVLAPSHCLAATDHSQP